MADKQSVLSIVIRTVDKATAGINAIDKRLDALTKPMRDFGKSLGELGEKSGFNQVLEGFKGVGGAVKETMFKVAELGLVVGETAHLLLEMVDKFATLGHTSEKLGVTVDFLAAMRFAAGKAGVPVEALDEGLTTLGQNLGQARAGFGRMATFVGRVSSALLSQLKAAKSNEQAFRLLADAMAKLTDPSERLALTQKTVGNSALAPLLAKGSKGLLELQGSYAGLAGSQEEAAKAAMEVEESLKDLGAVTDGIKAALVSGLAPALKIIVDRLAEWFTAHREDVKKWAIEIGEKLPGAVEAVVTAIGGAIGKVTSIVEAIGGLKTVAVALAAILVGPLLSSIFTLSVALLTTPVGWIITGLGLIALGAYELIKHWDGVKEFFVGMWDGIKAAFSSAWDVIKVIVDKVVGAVDAVRDAADFLNPFSGPSTEGRAAIQRTIPAGTLNAIFGPGTGQQSETHIKVDFANAPPGTRVKAEPQSTGSVDLSVGYQMVGDGGP